MWLDIFAELATIVVVKSMDSKLLAEMLYQKVGAKIKQVRKEKDVSQAELAKAIGLTRSSINNIEHGRHKVLLDTLWEISCKLKVPVINLLPSMDEVTIVSLANDYPENTPDDVRKWLSLEIPEE